MSGMGMLASALAGATGAVYQQATGDIEQGRKVDLAKEQADIDVQKQARISEAQEQIRRSGQAADFAFANDPTNVATKQGTARSNALTSAQDTRDATVAAVNDTGYQSATKRQADADAADAAARVRAATVAAGGDATFLSATTKLKLADPEVAARIAASRAQAGEATARTGLIHSQTTAADLSVADQKKLNTFYDEASAILSNASLTEEQRAQQFGKVQKQIVLMKSKNGTGGTRDPELDTESVKETKINPDGSTSETTRKQVRKAGNLSGDAPYPDGTELKGPDGKMYVVKDGQAVVKGGAPAATPKKTSPAATSPTDDMAGIKFNGDGYTFAGKSYTTPDAAKAARDKANMENNPMSRSLNANDD
jgi:hypothetical protein